MFSLHQMWYLIIHLYKTFSTYLFSRKNSIPKSIIDMDGNVDKYLIEAFTKVFDHRSKRRSKESDIMFIIIVMHSQGKKHLTPYSINIWQMGLLWKLWYTVKMLWHSWQVNSNLISIRAFQKFWGFEFACRRFGCHQTINFFSICRVDRWHIPSLLSWNNV